MSEGLTDNLLWESAVVVVLAAWVASRTLPLAVALLLALVRVGISTIYFAYYFDGAWTFLDDIKYLEDGSTLLRYGFDPISVLVMPDGYELICNISNGHHILYTWWNLAAEYLFGEYYYAPVLLNILVTFASGLFLARTLALLQFPRTYQVGMQVFYLLHWEVAAWSSFANLKDSIVQLLTVAILYCVVRFIRRRDAASVVAFVVVLMLFYWIRFYVPVMVLATGAVWMAWQWRDWRKYLLIPVLLAGGGLVARRVGENADMLDPGSLFSGTARFLLTPLAWNVQPEYGFLTIPAVFHLLFFLPAVYGAVTLWRTSAITRLYLIYYLVVVGLYAITDDLLGPRQRFQTAFILAWMQFHFLWSLRRTSAPASQSARTPVAWNRPLSSPVAGAWS